MTKTAMASDFEGRSAQGPIAAPRIVEEESTSERFEIRNRWPFVVAALAGYCVECLV